MQYLALVVQAIIGMSTNEKYMDPFEREKTIERLLAQGKKERAKPLKPVVEKIMDDIKRAAQRYEESKPDPYAQYMCCKNARREPCVCMVRVVCDEHGSKCHGTHD